jgi:hypothetical protein
MGPLVHPCQQIARGVIDGDLVRSDQRAADRRIGRQALYGLPVSRGGRVKRQIPTLDGDFAQAQQIAPAGEDAHDSGGAIGDTNKDKPIRRQPPPR